MGLVDIYCKQRINQLVERKNRYLANIKTAKFTHIREHYEKLLDKVDKELERAGVAI